MDGMNGGACGERGLLLLSAMAMDAASDKKQYLINDPINSEVMLVIVIKIYYLKT